jgi:spermidine synthase
VNTDDSPLEAPRLHTNSQTLSLSFASTLIQSCMRIDDPNALVLDYTKSMMGFLLVNPSPPRVLMIGLGGGSMLKYLHAHLPEADLTTVEISQEVIDLREATHIPPDSERLRIVCADGAAFVRQPPQPYDLILVDGFVGDGLPAALCSRGFYARCRQALTPEGVLVANVQADTALTREIRARLDKTFDKAVISFESDEGGNDILIAASLDMLARCRAEFDARWSALPAVHQDTLAVASTRIQRALLKIVRPGPPDARQ